MRCSRRPQIRRRMFARSGAGCFGWRAELSNVKLKVVASAVVLVGLAAALLFGGSPDETIIVAQVANGLLLPIVAVFLLYTMNRQTLMRGHSNGWIANVLGVVVVGLTAIIAIRQFRSVWNQIVSLLENGG